MGTLHSRFPVYSSNLQLQMKIQSNTAGTNILLAKIAKELGVQAIEVDKLSDEAEKQTQLQQQKTNTSTRTPISVSPLTLREYASDGR